MAEIQRREEEKREEKRRKEIAKQVHCISVDLRSAAQVFITLPAEKSQESKWCS